MGGSESAPSAIGLITFGTKQTGKRSAGKPHAAFDAAGTGNVTMVAGLRSFAKAMELPPEPTVRAPAPDPTCEGLGAKLPGATRQVIINGRFWVIAKEFWMGASTTQMQVGPREIRF